MSVGIAALIVGYCLSQFFRTFLAVLTPALQADLGATPADLAAASGYWFIAFALMQIPVGAALDRIGPRRTASALMLACVAGTVIFAQASSAEMVKLAMMLIGIGCSAVLMAGYYIFARSFAPALFATLAGAMVGIGNLGNIGSALPFSMAVEAMGWRNSLWALALLAALTAALIFLLVKDPPRAEAGHRGSLFDLLKIPALWPILVMMMVSYAPSAAIRGLWLGPYLRDSYGADAGFIGQVGLVMGLAMVAGSFAYGPLERRFNTRKWLILAGNALCLACIITLWLLPNGHVLQTAALLAGIGFAGASFPMVIAHGRALIPPHLTGRGVTLLNLFGVAPVGLMQFATGALHARIPTPPASAPYAAIFAFIAAMLALGMIIYSFAQDRTD